MNSIAVYEATFVKKILALAAVAGAPAAAGASLGVVVTTCGTR
jgi:hypothetical protein